MSAAAAADDRTTSPLPASNTLTRAAPDPSEIITTAGIPFGNMAPGTPRPDSAPALPVPVNSPAWPASLSQSVVQFISQAPDGSHHIQLQVHPAELGPIHIQLDLHDGTAQAVFFTAHAPVRQALEAALPQLQAQLAEAGVSLGQTNVHDHPAGHGHEDAGSDGSRPGRFAAPAGTAASGSGDALAAVERSRLRRPDALVDTYV